MPRHAPFTRRAALLAAGAALVPSAPVTANFTWNGGAGNDLWKDDANWAGGMQPPLVLDDMCNDIVFGSTGGMAQSPDVAGNAYSNIASISFAPADASLTLTDSVGTGSLTFADGGMIINDNAMMLSQTIDIDLVGTGDGLIIDAMTGDLVIGGDIDLSDTLGVLLTVQGDADTSISGVISGGGGALLKQGLGTLTLTGDNAFTGGAELAAGTIVLGSDTALGDGVLSVTGDATIESDLDTRMIGNDVAIADMTTLTIGGESLVLDGAISGDGGLVVDLNADDDLLTLDRVNTYTGDTTLTQGTAVLGTNMAFGTGEISLGGDFTLQSDANARRLDNDIVTLGNQLTISGGFNFRHRGRLIGAGSLLINMDSDDNVAHLDANSGFSGGTTLQKGTILLGTDGALGQGGLTLAGDGTIESDANARVIDNLIDNGGFLLRVAGEHDLALEGVISGAGGLTLDIDEGFRLTLAADNTYTGTTEINSGELLLEGSIDSSVNVNGGLLLGEGTMMGNLTVKDGGTVSPGESIGTLAIDGNYVQESGGDYVVEISNADDDADLLDISGTATLEAGSTITATVTDGGYVTSGEQFGIIEADGGITDNGAEIVDTSATVTVNLIRDPDFVNGVSTTYALELFRAANAYSNAALPGNNTRIGAALDSLISIADAAPSGLAANLLGSLDAFGSADYNLALGELSPQPYATTTAYGRANVLEFANQQASYLAALRTGTEAFPPTAPPRLSTALALSADDPLILSSAIAQAEAGAADGPAAPRKPEWGRYFKVQGVFTDENATATRPGLRANSFGFQAGIDRAFGSNFVAGIALGYAFTDADVDLTLSNLRQHTVRAGPYMSWFEGDWYLDGSATFGYYFIDGERNIPSLDLTADSSFNGYDITGYLGTGYRLRVGRNTYVTPIGSVLYSRFEFDGFTESGAGGANLAVSSRSDESLRSRVGMNVSYRVPDLKWKPVVYGLLAWEHEFFDDNDLVSAFAVGGSPFTINTGSRDSDAVVLGGGVNVLINRYMSAFLRIEYLRGETTSVTGVAGGVSVAF